MAHKNIEIEIQVNVENSKPLIEFLEKNGTFQSAKHQVDEYFSSAHIDKIRKIFSALNFKSIVIVDKLRKIWTYKAYEVAIDSVKTLGNFVEVEYIGKDEKVNPEKVTGEMVDFLKKVGCGKITRNYVGYPFLILFPKEVKYEIQ